MLRSHRILCSCVPAPFFVFLRRATPSHFHLHVALVMFPACLLAFRTPARCSHDYSISTARSMFPACPLAFRTPARCSHDYSISAARSMFPARLLAFPHARSLFPTRSRPLAFLVLAVSRTARLLFPACPRSLRARSLHCSPARPLISCVPVHRTARPLAASHFLLRLALPLRLAGKAEPGAERDKDRL
ncbi:hypothetical protein B0H13DRAFT_2369163 [Mycena leptocephala]|nr:hypothetical protein B0H13DRAFT_2369163 [Mycena leptocephala]